MSTGTMNGEAQVSYEAELVDWIEQEKAAIELIHIIGNLWFDKSVELILFRNQLVDRSASQILNLHQYAKEIVKKPISVSDTVLLARELVRIDLAPSRLDIGRLASEWVSERAEFSNDVNSFLTNKLKDLIGKDKRVMIPRDVVLYGFGRIGRVLARELVSQAGKGEQLRLRAIVTRSYSD